MVAHDRIYIFFKAEQWSIPYIHHILFIHSSTDGHLNCFYLLVAVNHGATSFQVIYPESI